MAVDNRNVIDIISIHPTGEVYLTIADHFEWDEGNQHLLVLQNKINDYLDAIESGELYRVYPNAKDRKVVIHVRAKYSPNATGKIFLRKVESDLESLGFKFEFIVSKK